MYVNKVVLVTPLVTQERLDQFYDFCGFGIVFLGNMTNPVPRQAISNSRFQVRSTDEEAKSYDFAKERPSSRKTTNVVEATGHLVKSALGAGVAAMHESYKVCGLHTAVVLNVVYGFAVFQCMWMLVDAVQKMYGKVKVPMMSYPDLAEASIAVGPWACLKKYSKCFRYTVDIIVMIDLFGSCCVYQVIVARSIKQLVEGTENVTDYGNPPIRIYILALVVPLLLLCMITSLKYLAPFSIVADVFIAIVAFATIYYGSKAATMSPLDMPAFKDITGLLEFTGVCVFSMEGIGATLAIENSMAEPKKCFRVLAIGMLIVAGLVMVVGFFGYWGFGEDSNSPITVNFPWEPFPILMKVFMILMVYVTYALNFWIPFDLVWHYIQRKHNPNLFWIWERVYRAIFVVIITGIAFLFPNVSKFIGLIGSFCLSNMGFIFPAFIELTLDWNNLGMLRWRLWRSLVMIIFGATVCLLGTYSNSKELILEVFYRK